MPDSRKHRSAGPKDRELFAPPALPVLAQAVEHVSYLFTHGYPERATLKLVGDRYDLTARQREAVMRAACGASERRDRDARRVRRGGMRGAHLAIDGFNVLTSIEVALGGGLILLARDGCARDLARMRGTWRKVAETAPALEVLGGFLEELALASCGWVLDAPVSNSGRLKGVIEALASRNGWGWTVQVVRDADRALIESGRVVASADRQVLDGCERWFNLGRELIEARIQDAWCADFSRAAEEPRARSG